MRGKQITISEEAYNLLVSEREICIKNAYSHYRNPIPVTFTCPKVGNRASELILASFGKKDVVLPGTGVYKEKVSDDSEK